MAKITNVVVNATQLGWGSFWLFTIGLCKLTTWQVFIAFFVWPYYLGDYLGR